MSILTIGAAGITAVLLAVWLKGVRAEYALYMVLGAQILFMICGTGRLEVILDAMRRLEGYIKIDPAYLGALLKWLGSHMWLSLPPESVRTRATALWEIRSRFSESCLFLG